jgi:hypothetical protein
VSLFVILTVLLGQPAPSDLDVPGFVAQPVVTEAFAGRLARRSGCAHWMQAPADEDERRRQPAEWESDSCGENWDTCVNGDLTRGGTIIRKRGHSLTILLHDLLAEGARMHLSLEGGQWRLDETVCNPHRRLSKADALRQVRRAIPTTRGDPMATVLGFWKSPHQRLTSALWQSRLPSRIADGDDARCNLPAADIQDVWYRGVETTHVDMVVAGKTRFVFVRLVPESARWKIDSVVCDGA